MVKFVKCINKIDLYIYTLIKSIEKMTSIAGFSKYLIYENGDVYSKIQKKILKTSINKNGYKILILVNDNGVRKNMYIHKLVALAYIPNNENKPCIDHIDEDKTNNHITNLRWATFSENRHNIKKPLSSNKLGFKNISITTRGKFEYYNFSKKINGKLFAKNFKTLEEAINYKDNYVCS